MKPLKKRSDIDVFPDDIFLVSYPKSGNTWFRFLIGNYLTNNQCDFANSHLIVPDIHLNPEYCSQLQRPRIIKSHKPYTPQYPRVVYLVRDGRDVAVSYYFHKIKYGKISPDTPFSDFLFSFNAGLVDKFTAWSDHVNSWIDHCHADFLLIKYEDMKLDPAREFNRFLRFSGLPIDQTKVADAIAASTFESMQKLEMAIANPGATPTSTILFVRQGESGAWRKQFTNELEQSFIHAHHSALKRLGYIFTTAPEMSTITVHPTTQQTDLERVRNQLQHKLTETEIKLEKAQFQAKQVKKKNQKIQAQLQTSLRKLERTQQKLEMLKTRSSETSGWLRRQWLKLKQRIGDRPSLK